MREPAVWQGPVDGRQVRVVVTGVGGERAAWAAEMALRSPRPQEVLIAGLCGGLDVNLRSGQVVQFSEIVDDPTGAVYHAAGGERIRHRLVSARQPVGGVRAKFELAQRRHAAAVDMESAALAAICQRLNVRWNCLRAVCDGARQPVPERITRLVRPDGTTRPLAAAGTLVVAPWSLPTMLRLGRSSRRATRALARSVAAWTQRQSRTLPTRPGPPDDEDAEADPDGESEGPDRRIAKSSLLG